MALGLAVTTLLHAQREELLLVTSSDVPDVGSATALALFDVEAFLGKQAPVEEVAMAAAASAHHHVLSLFLEFGAGKKRGARQHQQTATLLRWLLGHGAFGIAAGAELANGILCAPEANLSRLKLSAVSALIEALPLRRDTRCVWAPDTVVALLRATLRVCAELPASAAAATISARAAPTNLMVACADAAVACLAELCRRSLTPARDEPWTSALLGCTADAQRLVSCLRAWRPSHGLFATAATEVSDAFASGRGAATSVAADIEPLLHAAALWLACAPVLVSDAETGGSHRLLVTCERWLLQLGASSSVKGSTASAAADASTTATTAVAKAATAAATAATATAAAAAAAPLAGSHLAALRFVAEDTGQSCAPLSHEAFEAALGREALCGLCLQLAALSPGSRASLVRRLHERLAPALAARCTMWSEAALPLALLYALLLSTASDATAANTALQPFLDLLQATDVAGAAAVAAAATLAAAYPSQLLPDVIAKLGSPVVTQRANALAVLTRVSEAGFASGAAAGANVSRLLGRSSTEALTRNLVERLPWPAGKRERAGAAGEDLVPVTEPVPATAPPSWRRLLCRLDLNVTLPQLMAAAAAAQAKPLPLPPPTPPPPLTTTTTMQLPTQLPAQHRATLPSSSSPAEEAAASLHAVEQAMGDALIEHSQRDAATAASAAIDALRDGAASEGGPPPSLSVDGDVVSAVVSPGQIGPSTGARERGAAATAATGGVSPSGEVLLRAVERWAAELSADAWPRAFRVASAKFFAASQDVCSLQVLKRMLRRTASAPAWQALVVGAAVDRLRVLCPTADEDKDEDAAPSAEAPADKMRDAVSAATAPAVGAAQLSPYDRLRPLLLLQMLPEDGWTCAARVGECAPSAAAFDAALADQLPRCKRALLERFADDAELQPVRKMAIALAARLPPSCAPLAEMLARLEDLAADPRELASDARSGLAIYYLCCAVLLHPEVASTLGMPRHSAHIVAVLEAQGGEALDRLKMGCVDLLARLWGAELDIAGGGEGCEGCEGRGVETRALELLSAPATRPHALAVCNHAARMRHARGGARLAAVLVGRALPPLLAQSGAHVTQTLFDLAFHAQPHLSAPSLAALAKRAHSDAASTSVETRMAALKLLGVVLSVSAAGKHATPAVGPEEAPGADDLLKLLYSLGLEDASDEVRGLAQHLLGTAFGLGK